MKKVLSRQISAIPGSTASQGAPSPQRTCWLRRVARLLPARLRISWKVIIRSLDSAVPIPTSPLIPMVLSLPRLTARHGTYTFDEKTHVIQLKGLLLSASGYATKTTNGISLLFDQKKLLNLIKALSAFKGSSTLSAVGSIANNYDGMQVGFEMTK